MKILTLFTFYFLTLSVYAVKHYDSYKIYNKKGKEVGFEKVIANITNKSHVFFGEYHDNPISHWLQLELTQILHEKYKSKLVLGGEMFEADNQFILDEYLKGLISSKNFQNEMRLWPNYNTDYKPLIEFSKENKLKFIATNIPRRYASMVYKKGLTSLNELSDLAKSYIVPLNQFEFDSTVVCYKNILSMSHGGENMAKSQAIKDATMAYFILKNSKPNGLFLHFQGAYHSDNYEGIIHYIKKEIELKKILSISTVSQNDISELEKDNFGLADYTLCVKSNMTSTH